MADQLYLSLWFPNFRLEGLPAALVAVMRQFALISSSGGPGAPGTFSEGKRVSAASAYPIAFSEAPSYQRLYVNDNRSEDTSGSIIENAVAEATEQLHDDMAYEFEMRWNLWTPDSGPGSPGYTDSPNYAGSPDPGAESSGAADLDILWKPTPANVKIIGFAPHFDDSSFEQNGHVRVDFGLDYPWVLDDDQDDEEDDPGASDSFTSDDDSRAASKILPFHSSRSSDTEVHLSEAAGYIQKNVEMLLAFTLSVEKNCGISSRLLWTESGEPLAEKLIARLQRLN